jgi:hypothetical protein
MIGMARSSSFSAAGLGSQNQRRAGDLRPTASPGNAMMCPSMMALAVALVPGGVSAEELRFGQLVTLAVGLLIALLARLTLDFV